jgi:hypothetical protein
LKSSRPVQIGNEPFAVFARPRDNAEAAHAQDDFGVAVSAKSLLDHRLGVGDCGCRG